MYRVYLKCEQVQDLVAMVTMRDVYRLSSLVSLSLTLNDFTLSHNLGIVLNL